MPVSLSSIVKLKRECPHFAAACNAFLIRGLPTGLWKVWMLTDKPVDSRVISCAVRISAYRAAVNLKKLYDMGLLKREAVSSGNGMRYVYRREK